MKIKRRLAQTFLSALIIVQGVSTPLIWAQEVEQAVHYQLDVMLNVSTQESTPLKEVSYDVINKSTNEVVWSYRNGDTSDQNDLTLEPGEYTFRLYNWDTVGQNGEIIADELEQSIAEPTEEERQQNKTLKMTHTPGQVTVLGDGSVVYDVDFEVKATESLYNAETQQYQAKLTLYLADPETANLTNNPDGQTEESPEENKGELILRVVDAQTGQPIAGVQVEVAGSMHTTDDNGHIHVANLEAGEHILTVNSVPEGYELPSEAENISAEAGQAKEVTLGLTKKEVAPQTVAAVFEVVDNEGNPVQGVTVLMEGVERTTNEVGQAVFEELVSGQYHYEVVGLPASYTGTPTGDLTVDTAQGNTTVNLSVEKTVETGTVRFVVKDNEGNPVANVGITLQDSTVTTNEEGIVEVSQLRLGEYHYTITAVPEGMTIEQTEGQFSIASLDEVVEVGVQAQKAVVTSSLTFAVMDQNQQPVVDAQLLVDEDIVITTDENGQATVDNLTLGQHQYQVKELPEGYSTDLAPQTVEVAADNQPIILSVTQAPRTQSGRLVFVDQFNQPIANANVELNGQLQQTNQEGTVNFENVSVGTQIYSVSNLPEKFEERFEGQIDVNAEQSFDQTVTISRSVEKGKVVLTVVNQDQQPLANVTVQFGGLTGTTNEAGQVEFKELEIGKYYYRVTDAPSGVKFNDEEQLAEITEGLAFENTLVLEQEKKGTAQFIVRNPNNQPLSDIEVAINDQVVRTNAEGIASFNDMNVGEHTFNIKEVLGYQLSQMSGTINVAANETVTVNIVATAVETTTEVPTTEAPITEATTQVRTTTEVATMVQSLKQLVDPTSNIEVWLHPDDAGKVARLQVTKETQNIPSSLKNKDVDLYNIRLLDANNQEVTLTKTVQVKIPTRTVNSKIQLVHVQQNQLTTISHTVHNQRANFTTQQLGQYALVYGERTAATTETTTTTSSTTVAVSTSKDVERRIPATGEKTTLWIMLVAVASIVLGAMMILKKTSAEKE